MSSVTENNSRIIDGIAFFLSLHMIIAGVAGAVYTNSLPYLIPDWIRIMTTPCPLVTDYFEIGSLGAGFLNAGACGMAMFFFMHFFKGPSHANSFAGYFLVIAHAFYGLNFLNMWPCFLAPLLYLKLHKLNFNNNLHVCMFCTCFSPFVSELLFRYTLGSTYEIDHIRITVPAVLLTILFTFLVAYVAPAILPGARAWHKGYNLYNGGLAFGLFGFLLYTLLYRSFGAEVPTVLHFHNPVYESFGRNYIVFVNIFYILIFAVCLAAGWYLNDNSFKGLRLLITDTGYQSNFAERYGMPLCLINMGIYGSMMLLYMDLTTLFTDGAGFTGPTTGIILASLTFAAMGQHFANTWPILAGYELLYLAARICNTATIFHPTWTVSTQGYLNAAAFATGLCPIVGRYGRRAGVLAGLISAAICTSTSAIHGGLMLYNGGFTAGITAMILLPILEHFIPVPRQSMNGEYIDPKDQITVIENSQ